MKASLLIDFMRRLVRESQKEGVPKVFLVLDNLKVQHARQVQA